MKKFYVALSTPSVEMPIKAKDVSGKTGTISVGFKRYSPEEGFAKIDELNALVNAPILEEPAEVESFPSVAARERAIQEFLTKEILYVKNVEVYTEEEPGLPLLYKTVEDSRTEKDQELLGEKNSCLDFLLDMLFASTPWGSAFIEVFYEVHLNLKLGADAEVKN